MTEHTQRMPNTLHTTKQSAITLKTRVTYNISHKFIKPN